MEEKKELKQEELSEVNGGYNYTTVDGKHYWGFGTDTQNKYICPKCGRPVHPGSLSRFYCDPCDTSWFFESQLQPNLNSGYWKEMTDEEWEDYLTQSKWAEGKNLTV